MNSQLSALKVGKFILVILLVIIFVIGVALAVVWATNFSLGRRSVDKERPALTAAEWEQVFDSLESATGTTVLTSVEMDSLESAAGPSRSREEWDEILDSLDNK